MANNTVVMTMDFNPNPNSTIRTGTRAVRGALRNTLTQGSSSSSISLFFPIRIPTGMPIVTEKKVPRINACAVSFSTLTNGFVVMISDNVIKTSDKAGMKKVNSN